MLTIRIDNREVQVEEGATILQAARKLGIDIPALCYREGCTPQTSCLACVVKVTSASGNGSTRLVPSCATRAAEGMSVDSETEDVRAARRTALELLLADHAGDCLAPCTNVCPAHMDIPLMIRQIREGHLHDALVTVKRMIALPAVLGRICPELCEKGCRRASVDSPVSICRLKRHVADEDLASPTPYLPPVAEPSGKRVAIVGSGPTGLAAAWYLLQYGHACVIFDEHPEPGGNLRYAVNPAVLPRDVLDAEIGLVRRLGAEFRLNVRVGRDVTLEQLRGEFDAVLMAVGEIDKARAAALGLAFAARGLKADRDSMATSVPGVFAAGGAITPLKHAVRAVADGREAARIIDCYVRGMVVAPDPRFTVRLGVLSEAEMAAFSAGAKPDGRAPAGEGGAGLNVPAARQEAGRCLECDCVKLHDCLLRKYSAAYGASPTVYKTERKPFERELTHASVVYEPGKCIACGLCVQITERAAEPLGLTYVGRGFRVRISAPFNQEMSEAMQRVAEECVRACPTAALSFKDRPVPAPSRQLQEDLSGSERA